MPISYPENHSVDLHRFLIIYPSNALDMHACDDTNTCKAYQINHVLFRQQNIAWWLCLLITFRLNVLKGLFQPKWFHHSLNRRSCLSWFRANLAAILKKGWFIKNIDLVLISNCDGQRLSNSLKLESVCLLQRWAACGIAPKYTLWFRGDNRVFLSIQVLNTQKTNTYS